MMAKANSNKITTAATTVTCNDKIAKAKEKLRTAFVDTETIVPTIKGTDVLVEDTIIDSVAFCDRINAILNGIIANDIYCVINAIVSIVKSSKAAAVNFIVDTAVSMINPDSFITETRRYCNIRFADSILNTIKDGLSTREFKNALVIFGVLSSALEIYGEMPIEGYMGDRASLGTITQNFDIIFIPDNIKKEWAEL